MLRRQPESTRTDPRLPYTTRFRVGRIARSTGLILAAASGRIAHNEGRLGKTLWTEDEAGEKLRLRGLWDGESEARFVGEEIEALVARDKNHDLKQVAILVRTGAQTRAFEERFKIGRASCRDRGCQYV